MRKNRKALHQLSDVVGHGSDLNNAATTCRLVYGGGDNLYLISTLAIKFYFDTDLPAIKEFTTSLGGAAGEVFQCVDTMEEIKKNEHVSIQDLHPFISISNEQTQADFICKLGLSRSSTKLAGRSSHGPDAAVSRTNLALLSATTKMFLPTIPGEMIKLTKQHGTALALEEINGGGGGNYQDVLKSLLARSTFFRDVLLHTISPEPPYLHSVYRH
ncbi:hypothetical protein Bca4012_070690 [Brassica carinata]